MRLGSDRPPRLSPSALFVTLPPILLLLVAGSVRWGSSGAIDLSAGMRGILAAFDLATPLEGNQQAIVELRLWRALTAAGVGGALGLSGALLQGLLRNGLASPTILGVNAGASLGASIGILVLGGYGPRLLLGLTEKQPTVLPAVFAFLGALSVSLVVLALASRGGRISVPTLLLVGIAMNTCLGGLLSAIQSLTLEDYELSRAIIAWNFGNLDDKSPTHVAIIWSGLGVTALVLPFISVELDLFRGGEEDAESMGVRTNTVKILAVSAAALAAAFATSVAGQIAFVGLIVPHVVRLLVGSTHRTLLPLSILGGAVFLLGAEFAQLALLGERAMRPGVLMSLFGGAFFLLLLMRSRRELEAW